MKKISIEKLIDIDEMSDELETVGWIDTLREHKDFVFIIIRDGISHLQAIVDKSLIGEIKLVPESVISVKGQLIKNEVVKLHKKELIIKEFEILSQPTDLLPIGWDKENYPSLDQRLDFRSISLREPLIQLVFKLISFCEYELRKYCHETGFTEIHTPKLIGSPSESGSELFSLDYFDTTAYLAQSPQFYKQMAIAGGFRKVMEVGPVFRAEPSFTSRHLTEFTGLDFEIAYIESFEDVMKEEEQLIQTLFKAMKDNYGKQVKEICGIDIEVPETPFPRISFEECRTILEKEFSHFMPEGEDISSEGEKLIYEYTKKLYGHDFVFITHYPSKVRAFYTMRSKDEKWSESFDLIYKGVEITSGAQREHRYEILKQQILEKGLSLDHLQFYLDFFRYGVPPHGGFGIGLMRIFMKMFDFQNIREVSLSPRDPKRLKP